MGWPMSDTGTAEPHQHLWRLVVDRCDCCHWQATPSDDSCRCNEQAREIGGEALRRVEAEQGRRDDSRRES